MQRVKPSANGFAIQAVSHAMPSNVYQAVLPLVFGFERLSLTVLAVVSYP